MPYSYNDLIIEKSNFSNLYNVDYFLEGETCIVTSCQHNTWNFIVGKGETIHEAIKNMEVKINMYDDNFQEYRDNIIKGVSR